MDIAITVRSHCHASTGPDTRAHYEKYMLFISHRGNTDGPNCLKENTIDYINESINLLTVDVMVDVWTQGGEVYLDSEQKMPIEYIHNSRIWFHCWDIEALEYFKTIPRAKYFWHESDTYTLTSNSKVWVKPGGRAVPGSIAVLPEFTSMGNEIWGCHAICTDYVFAYQTMYKEWNSLQNLLI